MWRGAQLIPLQPRPRAGLGYLLAHAGEVAAQIYERSEGNALFIVALAAQDGFPFWQATGTVLAGWGQVTQGEVALGIAQMRTGLASMKECGALVHRAHYLTLLTEAVGKTGGHAAAVPLIEKALAEGDQNGEGFYTAEAWRIKGELLLVQMGNRRQSQDKGQKREKAISWRLETSVTEAAAAGL